MKSQDEQIMAALSHVTILLPLMGVIGPIVVWATQREKSDFVAFQALQALVYQLSLIVLYFLWFGCYMISVFVSMGGGILLSETLERGEAFVMLSFFLPFLIFGVVFFLGIAYVIYGIVGAVQVFRGRNFRYVLIGRWVERYLREQGDQERSETGGLGPCVADGIN